MAWATSGSRTPSNTCSPNFPEHQSHVALVPHTAMNSSYSDYRSGHFILHLGACPTASGSRCSVESSGGHPGTGVPHAPADRRRLDATAGRLPFRRSWRAGVIRGQFALRVRKPAKPPHPRLVGDGSANSDAASVRVPWECACCGIPSGCPAIRSRTRGSARHIPSGIREDCARDAAAGHHRDPIPGQS